MAKSGKRRKKKRFINSYMINSHRKELRAQRARDVNKRATHACNTSSGTRGLMVSIPLKIVGGILWVEADSAGVNYAEESVRAEFTRLAVLRGRPCRN